jgi:uncharacterized protein (DUF3084 family)
MDDLTKREAWALAARAHLEVLAEAEADKHTAVDDVLEELATARKERKAARAELRKAHREYTAKGLALPPLVWADGTTDGGDPA